MKGYVGFIYAKKTGKIVLTVVNEYSGLMQMVLANKVTPSREAVIVDANTGNVIFRASGKKNDFPDIEYNAGHTLGFTCEDIGIPLAVVQSYFQEVAQDETV